MEMDSNSKLIQVVQLPVIQQQLMVVKEAVEKRTAEAESLVCTDDTAQACKKVRADLKKEYDYFEDQRKAIKASILAPYEEFEAVYKECVAEAYKRADGVLKGKIDDVEGTIKQNCENELREYFSELIIINHVEWLTYERLGIKVGLSEAKQTTKKKLREQVLHAVVGIANAVTALSEMEHSDELVAEFKQCLDMPLVIRTVGERHQKIQQEREAREATAEVKAREAEAIKAVEKAANNNAPEIVQPPKVEQKSEKVYTAKFTAHGTIEQLKALKVFMNENGITFET